MANQIVWCDIPVLDLDRAVKFYSAVLGQAVKKQDFPGMTIGTATAKSVRVCLPARKKNRRKMAQ